MAETQQDLNGKKLKVFEKRTHEIIVRRVRGKPENESSITISICTNMPTEELADAIRELVKHYGRPNKDSEPSDTDESA